MNMKKKLSIICVITVLVGAAVAYNAYGFDEENSINNQTILLNSAEDLNNISSYLEQFENNKIQLSGDEIQVDALSFKLEDRTNKIHEDDIENKMVMLSDKETALPTLSSFNIEEAKKVYIYSNDFMELIIEGKSLENEGHYWQIPITNTIGENGVVYLEELQLNESLVTKAVEFPLDNRDLFLENDQIINLVNEYSGSIITNIIFVSLPISNMGTVCAAVQLDTDDILFVTVHDKVYYNDMEYKKVYTFEEMNYFIDSMKIF